MVKVPVLAAATLAGLSFAQTDVSPITGCATTETPTELHPNIYCGTKGVLRYKIPIRPYYTFPMPATNQLQLCRNSCLMDDTCVSFSYNNVSNRCRLYGKPLIRQGYKDKTSEKNTVHYNRNCFERVCPGPTEPTCDVENPQTLPLDDSGCPFGGPTGFSLLQLQTVDNPDSFYNNRYIQLQAPVESYKALTTDDPTAATLVRANDAGNLQTFDPSCQTPVMYAEQDYTAGHSPRFGAGYEAIFFETIQNLQAWPYFKRLVCGGVDDGQGGTNLDCISYRGNSVFMYCDESSSQIPGLNLGNATQYDCEAVTVKMVCPQGIPEIVQPELEEEEE